MNYFIDVGGIWHISIFLGVSLAAFFFVFQQPLNLSAKCLWIYAIIQCFYLIEYPSLPFGKLTHEFQATAAQTLAEIIFIPLLVLRYRLKWNKFVTLIYVLEILSVWIFGYGLMGHISFDNAFLALLLPFAAWWLWIPAAASIVFHHGTTALLMMAIPLIYTFPWVSLMASPVALYLAWIYRIQLTLGLSDRLHAWIRYMDFWKASGARNMLLGVGPGSFAWCSMIVDHFKGEAFFYMHNDWLQILFEYGWVGLGLAGWVFIDAFKTSRIRPILLSAAVFGLTYSPLRFFPSAFMIALIINNV
jgi:hypothetical protein